MFSKRTKYAVFTVDVESFTDTECISNSGAQVQADMLDGLDEYIRILDKYQIKSTMFSVCRTALAAKERIAPHVARGHSLALHSMDHTAPCLLTNEQFRQETALAKQLLSEAFQTEVSGYRAPCFGIDNEKLQILRELGFLYDSSRIDFAAARHTVDIDMNGFQELRRGIFRSGEFFEFGLAHNRVFGQEFPISGGGYVRMFNWHIMKAAIMDYINRHDYYVFYLHPFELSRTRVPFVPKLKFYDRLYLRHGIRSFPHKVESIIKLLQKAGYVFVTFEQLAAVLSKKQQPHRAADV